MNDLDLLAGMAADTPLPELSDLAGARARLTDVLAAKAALPGVRPETRSGARPRPRAGRRGRLIAGAAGVAVIGAAAAVTAVVVMPDGSGRAGVPQAGPSPRQTTASMPAAIAKSHGLSRPRVQTAKLTAQQVLDTAAALALTQAPVTPRPGQFVYVKTYIGGGDSQAWYSVDGRHNGLLELPGQAPTVLFGCPPNGHYAGTGRALPSPAAPKTTAGQATPIPAKKGGNGSSASQPPIGPCTAQPAFFPDMPTTESAMGPWLAQTQGATTANLNDLAKTAGTLLEDDYLLPAQRAALYRFLATTPGLSVVHGVRDSTGRAGVGITWSFGGSATLVFDRGTLDFLGWNTVGLRGQVGGDAVLAIAITGKAGQVPQG